MTNYLAIDIGGTSIKYGLIDHEGQLLESHELPTKAYKGGPYILQTTKDLLASYLEKGPVAGVAISSAGMVDPEKGEIFYSGPQIPNYAGTQFKKEIEETFDVPCEIENDVNCAGLAEVLSGNGQKARIAVCLTIGTGIGGCLVLNGQIFHGFNYAACEVGYLHLQDGAFQDLASTTALVQYVAAKHEDPVEHWNGRRIFKEATEGNKICMAGIDRMVDYLGKGIANICYVVNPEVVILGGGIMAQEAILKPKIYQALKEALVPSLADTIRLEFAHHQNTAGMLGAYYHFRNRHE